jgi:integrase
MNLKMRQLTVKAIEKLRREVKVTGKRQRVSQGSVTGLMLSVDPSPRKGTTANWFLRADGRDFGLGTLEDLPLEAAINRALEVRRQWKATGIHPIDAKRKEAAARAVAAVADVTFGQCAEKYLAQYASSWRHRKSYTAFVGTVLGRTPQGTKSESDWCAAFRGMPVAALTTPVILNAIEDKFRQQPTTGLRVCQRIASVCDWAVSRQLRQPPNPASWSVLSKALPDPRKLKQTKNFAAVPHAELPAFMGELRQREGSAAKALEFLIHAALRTQECLALKWSEIDLDNGLLVLPPERTKNGQEFRQSLSVPALALLQGLPRDGGDLVFLSSQPNKPLAPASLLRVMHRLKRSESVHGFRSSFSDWAAEVAHAEPLISEMCLAHVQPKIERTYRRSDLLARRKRLMEAWGAFLAGESVGGAVVALR